MHRGTLALCLITGLLALGGCKKKATDGETPVQRGSGVGSSVERKLPPFSRVEIGGSFEVTINVGKDGPLELRGDDNLFEYLPSPVVKGELRLKPDVTFKPTQPFRIAIATEKLDRIAVSASSKVTIHGVKADAFEVYASGASRVTADGSAGSLSVMAKSAAQVDFTLLPTGAGVVNASEASRVRLGHIEKLNATQRGIAMIVYRGAPALTKRAENPKLVGATD